MVRNERFLVAGEHFYQPPRQATHARIQDLQTQEVDWNQVISKQCYIPQIENGTLDLASFDFFSTIRKEMENFSFQEAEQLKEVMKERGVGDPFLHVLLPDLSQRDKRILIQAGYSNFVEDTGVAPQWFWAPETALDNATLEVLAQVGYQGVLCAPEQIYGAGGEVDNHPVMLDLENGESILALPFDRPLSSSLAFDQKNNADTYTKSMIIPRIMRLPTSVPLVFWTDGETFGHHDKLAHLFLDYLLRTSLPNNEIEVVGINDLKRIWQKSDYKHGKLRQRTAWSCPHGDLRRWHGACPCDEGLHGGWKTHFSNGLKRFNAQVDVVLGKKLGKDWEEDLICNFSQAFYYSGSKNNKMSLLAAKASALAAQISCGTFFNDPGTSGKINLLFARQSIEHLLDAGQGVLAQKIRKDLLSELSRGVDPTNGKVLTESLAGLL